MFSQVSVNLFGGGGGWRCGYLWYDVLSRGMGMSSGVVRMSRRWGMGPGIPRNTVGRWAVCILLECCLVTGRNEVVAKVIFLQVSVCPRGGVLSPGGGVLSPGGCT